MSEVIRVKGDATAVSTWDDTDERSGPPADLYDTKWPEWHKLLLRHPNLHGLVGGPAVVREFELMFVPVDHPWNDIAGRLSAGRSMRTASPSI